MTKWVNVDPVAHRELRIATGASARFGDDVGVISVVPSEYPRLVAHYPIFLRKNAHTGRFEPGVLLGFGNRENLFLVGEQWDADYVPLQIQRQPFSVAPQRDGNSRPERHLHGPAGTATQGRSLQIAFDAESPRVLTQGGKGEASGEQAPRGELLFGSDGEPTPYLRQITSVLTALVSGASEALEYSAMLAQFDLIEPVRIDAEFVDGSEVKLQGLYTIKTEGLQSLPGDRLVELRDRGFLRWAYYQLASSAHVAGLVKRRNRILSGLPVQGPAARG